MRKAILILAAGLSLAALPAAFAEDVEIVTDESALFGEESDSGVEAVAVSKEGSALSSFLKTEGLRWGGSFTGSVEPSWTMRAPWSSPSLDAYGLDTTVAGSLFFDARPDEDFRVYGKLKTSYPFASSANVLTAPAGSLTATDSAALAVPNVQIFELFADWTYNDALFLRFGKHTVKWGVGYFFSPADVINLGRIDPLDPTAQREGPVSLRIHYPVLGTQTNLWAYAILPSGEDPKPEEIAGAAKVEFLLAKSWELGLGAYYKYDSAPRAVLTASGSFWKLNLFGEAVASWGSDRNFVTDVHTPVGIPDGIDDFATFVVYEDKLFFSGTAGLTYSNADDNWSVATQYFYNGDGYSDADREKLIDQARNLLDSLGSSTATPVYQALIANTGRHYAAASLTKSELVTDDLSVGLFAFANLSDLSGFVTPSVSYELFDKASLELSATFVFGSGDSEYVVLNEGAALTLGFKASLGSGTF